MSGTVATPEQRQEARRLHEQDGWSQRRIAQHLGLNPSTIGRWAKADHWDNTLTGPRPRTPTDADLAEAQKRAEAASAAARARWAVARADVADKAGAEASKVLAKIMDRVEAGKDSDARQLAITFGILVDKASLLSGDSMARTNRGEEPNLDPATRPTDPAAMAAAGQRRALQLVPHVDVESRVVGE